jgi:2'-hydroxyisoflavone reductase
VRILFFGGTGFVGRHAVEACLARSHDVTIVCRGLSDPLVFPDVPRIAGDRADPATLALVAARSFDAVIDTSGYLPRDVGMAAAAVATSGVHYVFVSSVSVYADFSRPPDESTRTRDPILEGPLTRESYSGLKVACERVVREILGHRACIVRAGRILGPHDADSRAPSVLRRIAKGGEVAAPGDPTAPTQLVDVRDHAAFLVRCAEERVRGTYNVVSPSFPATELFDAMRAATGSDAQFCWIPEEVLLSHRIDAPIEAPFWVARIYADALRVRPTRALESGLSLRPVAETLRDEWTWMRQGWEAAAPVRAHSPLGVEARLSAERERALLASARR